MNQSEPRWHVLIVDDVQENLHGLREEFTIRAADYITKPFDIDEVRAHPNPPGSGPAAPFAGGAGGRADRCARLLYCIAIS